MMKNGGAAGGGKIGRTLDRIIPSKLKKSKDKMADAISPDISVKSVSSSAENPLNQAIRPIIEATKDAAAAATRGSGDLVREAVVEPLQQLKGLVTRKSTSDEAPLDACEGENRSMPGSLDNSPVLSPDQKLEQMDVLFTRVLQSVTIVDWYETCWSEGNQTERPPFYGPWLSSTGKKDVSVSAWEFCSPQGGEEPVLPDSKAAFVNEWDQQEYQQRRTVTFQNDNNSAFVTHTQFCRIEASQDQSDRCIVALSVKMKGIPFADAFSVNIRWVATRTASDGLLLQVGLFVDFSKQVLVAGKIRSNTTTQTTKAQLDLFRAMSAACGCQEDSPTAEIQGDVMSPKSRFSRPIWRIWFAAAGAGMFRSCFPNIMAPPQSDFAIRIDRLRDLSRTIRLLESPPNTMESVHALGEIVAAHESLNNVLVFLLKGTERPVTAPDSSTDSRSPHPTPQTPLRNPLQAYFLDPIFKLVDKSGEESSETERENERLSSCQSAGVCSSDVAPRAAATKSGPTGGIFQHLEACLPFRSTSLWVERDPELGRNVRWLETKLKAIEVLGAGADEDGTPDDEDIVRELNAAAESLTSIVDWHFGIAQEGDSS